MEEKEICRFFDENLNAYLDGELDREAREKVNQHAAACPECGEKLETMTRLLTMCAEMDEGLTVPLKAQAAWREAVRAEALNHRKKVRMSGWTKSAGWIAAALTLLVVSTLATRPLSTETAPLRRAERAVSYAADEPAANADVRGIGFEYSSDDSLSAAGVTLMGDGSVEDSSLPSSDTEDQSAENALMIVKSASCEIESFAYDADNEKINTLVEEYNGYFSSDTENKASLESRERNAVIRVPSKDLDDFLKSLDAIGTMVYRNQTAEDVSSSYYDTSARLEALKLQRDRLNQHISDAVDASTVVGLEDKYYEVQGEIDSLESQMRNLEQMSEVSVRLLETPEPVEATADGSDFSQRVKAGFSASVEWLSGFLKDMVVVLAAAAPVLVIVLPVLILVLIIVKVVRARRKK